MVQAIQLPGATWESIGSSPAASPAGLGSLAQYGQVLQSSANEFADGMSLAVGSLSPNTKGSFADSNPELAIAVDAMGTIIESAMGAPAGQPVGAQVANVVADVVTQVSQGTTLVGSAIKNAAAAAGGAADAIPVIGGIVALMVGGIGSLFTAAAVSPGEQAALQQKYAAYCAEKYHPLTFGYHRGTGPSNQVDPSDLVAQDDARIRLIEWLAGGGSRDPAMRANYNKWHAAAASKYKISGIPVHVQREIVLLLEGIYAARRVPGCLNCAIVGDNGRFLFGVLLQILLDQSQKSKPGWTEASVTSLANWFVAPKRQYCVIDDTAGAVHKECLDLGPCSKDNVPLGRIFNDFVYGWKVTIEESANWQKAREEVGSTPKLSKLTLGPGATVKLLSSAETVEQAAARKRWIRRGLIGGGVVLGGGTAFWGARKLAARR
ncbi:MAG: hypothetical protein JRD89_02290 [Deltaproteobacteria bacterium]|nr:hypothetical protein [Deltaproteobacteria bacterium]